MAAEVTWLRSLLLAAGTLLALGCGRRATPADCRLIVDKSVELELKTMSRTDRESIAKREEQVREELKGELKSCEGRHVTDRTMSCVHSAATSADLDQCLR